MELRANRVHALGGAVSEKARTTLVLVCLVVALSFTALGIYWAGRDSKKCDPREVLWMQPNKP